MRIQIANHQDKADALIHAITAAGHEIVLSNPDILLIDFDGPFVHYPKTIERAYEQGAEVYLYSHGGHPITAWDGIWTPSDRVSAYLAQTPGQKRVMEAYGYPYPIHVIGWHYSELLPFEKTPAKKVLFAPWHPQGTGWLIDEGKEANERIFRQLLRMPDIELTCRFVFRLEDNRIPFVEGVRYEKSDRTLTGAIASIKAADVVVSYGTLAYLAVALGKPTIMYGQDCHPYDGYSEATKCYVKSWEKYKDIMHYPHDGSRLGDIGMYYLLKQGCLVEATKWRQEFIGEAFDASAFVALLEKLKHG